ncbi:MAG: hypothetical protein QM755_02420 [Luteolibacter sp.]
MKRDLLLSGVLGLLMFSCSAPQGTMHGHAGGAGSGTASVSWYDYVNRLMPPEERKIGPYENPYKGDVNLAGLEIYQKPYGDNAVEDYSDYLGDHHPGTINYHFWDGRIRSVNYSKDGKVLSEYWDAHATGTREGHGTYQSWEMVDFRLGSDPEFKKHRDPRKRG